MTSTKPLAPHGTYARYVGRPASNIPGCRCPLCDAEGRRYIKRRDYLTATGRPLTVDATPTRNHLQALFAAGAGWNQITAASGRSSSTISGILAGRHPEIRRSTQDAILAVHIGSVLKRQTVPALGAIRRVRALAAISHSTRTISRAAGVSCSTVNALLAGAYERITTDTDTAITRAFNLLSMTPGGNATARGRAVREGWPSPLAWWDSNIDDPDAKPILDATPDPDDEGDKPDIDEIAIARLVRGDHSIRLNEAERAIAARQMAQRGISPFATATALHTNVRSVRVWLAPPETAAA